MFEALESTGAHVVRQAEMIAPLEATYAELGYDALIKTFIDIADAEAFLRQPPVVVNTFDATSASEASS